MEAGEGAAARRGGVVTGLLFTNPATGEKQYAPTLGMTIFSSTAKWADDDIAAAATPKGGVIVDERLTDIGVVEWKVVGVYRGQVHYEWIPEPEVDWVSYNAVVRRRVLVDLAGHLNRQPGKHLEALLALNQALVNLKGLAS